MSMSTHNLKEIFLLIFFGVTLSIAGTQWKLFHSTLDTQVLALISFTKATGTPERMANIIS